MEKMDIEQFAEYLTEQGEYKCRCNVISNPPCGFCESGVNDLYEEYLEEEE